MDNLHPERVCELTAIDPEKAERLGKRYRGSIEKLSVAAGLDIERILSIIEDASPLNQEGTEMEQRDAAYKYYLLGDKRESNEWQGAETNLFARG